MDAVGFWQLQVHQDDVGPQLGRALHAIVGARRHSHDGHVGLPVQHFAHPDCLGHAGLDDEDAQHGLEHAQSYHSFLGYSRLHFAPRVPSSDPGVVAPNRCLTAPKRRMLH
jgi:hypothetical protein